MIIGTKRRVNLNTFNHSRVIFRNDRGLLEEPKIRTYNYRLTKDEDRNKYTSIDIWLPMAYNRVTGSSFHYFWETSVQGEFIIL